MFTLPTKKSLTVSLLAGAAAVLVSGSAVHAQTYVSQGNAIEPQTPIYTSEEYTYTRTERPAVPVVNTTRMQDSREMGAVTATPERLVENPNGIRYLSGGIGGDEQERFKAAESEYPVKVVFANSNGAYMSNVDISVTDKSGATILSMKTNGPILLLDLDPGSYTIKATDQGQVKTQNITVSDTAATKTYTVHFKTTDAQGYSMVE